MLLCHCGSSDCLKLSVAQASEKDICQNLLHSHIEERSIKLQPKLRFAVDTARAEGDLVRGTRHPARFFFRRRVVQQDQKILDRRYNSGVVPE